MGLTRIHSYLVLPAKHEDEQPEICGSEVPRTGKLFAMLSDLFDRAADECQIEIVFRPDSGGAQKNDSRDLLVEYARGPTVVRGRHIAARLQRVTTHRSGLGLLFLLSGTTTAGVHCLVVSRFPADSGVLAQESGSQLTVEFIERVFMRSTKAYKSVYLTTRSLEAGFASGFAIDRQLSGPRDVSDYWIRDFLLAELKTTGPTGTRRLAIALREAVRAAGPGVKQELIAAVQLLRGQTGVTRSAMEMFERLSLSSQAIDAVRSSFSRPDLLNDRFQFDLAEFNAHIAYRILELDNGAMLTAEDSRFDEAFKREQLVAEAGFRYSTQGLIVDQRLRRVK